MKKLSFIFLLAVLLFACNKDSDHLASPNDEIATAPNEGSKQVTRVFKGDIFTSIDPDPSNTPIGCSGDVPNFGIPSRLLLHGTATHLGELISQESTLAHVSCNLNVSAMQLTIAVSGQLTASNGDRIFYTGNDVIDVTNLLTQQPGPGSIGGTWTITGGTGRFEDASGSFTINGTVDFATLSASFKVEGTITY